MEVGLWAGIEWIRFLRIGGVLILVLMEVGLWDRNSCGWHIQVQQPVLILVLMEVGLWGL